MKQKKDEKAAAIIAAEAAAQAPAPAPTPDATAPAAAIAEAIAETAAPIETPAPTEATPTEATPTEVGEAAPLPLAAAWGKFLSSLSPDERETLIGVLTRLATREAARREAEEEQAILAEMDSMPAFAGILSRRGELDALIGRIGWLRALPMRDRLAAACYLDRGMRLHEPTREEKLEAILSDPALMRALAEKQAMARAAGRGAFAPTARAGGRMPANLPKPPKDLREAGLAAKQYFHV